MLQRVGALWGHSCMQSKAVPVSFLTSAVMALCWGTELQQPDVCRTAEATKSKKHLPAIVGTHRPLRLQDKLTLPFLQDHVILKQSTLPVAYEALPPA